MYDDNIEKAMHKWARERDLLALDLGAAHNPAPGYKTVDMHGDPDFKGDIFDVLGSMPDNSVGLIRAVDFCEHIADKIRLWNELYRVLAHGGMVLSLTPSTDGRGAYQDPTHVAFYNSNSFLYFYNESFRNFVPELTCKFDLSRIVDYFPSDWHRKYNIPYVCCNLIANKTGERFGGSNLAF
jgi:SAM-dependent methyltransferase